MQVLGKGVMLWLFLTASVIFAQQPDRFDLGTLNTGATVSFVRVDRGEWGIQIIGGTAPKITQSEPSRLDICQTGKDIRSLAAGYKTVQASDSGVDASAEIAYGKSTLFRVQDHWSLDGAVVSLRRKVEVEGSAPGGFNSSVVLMVDPSVKWQDVNCLAPGALYGDPTYNGDRSPGGTLNYAARRFLIREDMLPAPLFALSFGHGSSVAMLDPSPRGESTVEETRLSKEVMVDERFGFGTLGAWQEDQGPIQFGFQFPGSAGMYAFGPNAPTQPRWFRRFHPIAQGVAHQYTISFRFGTDESFRDVTRNSWRWAWSVLKPAVTTIDIELVRRVLIDHLAAQAATIDGRTAIPFAVATYDTNRPQWNWTMAAMGFVSKNIECADQLLREGDRDSTDRGKKMRQTGLAIISSMLKALPTVPLQGTGYDLATGKPWDHIWLAPWLRNATEDMRVQMRAYRRERSLGRQHPEWFAWVKSYVDWLIAQQRNDGSFPRRWKSGSSQVAESTGTTSYCPVPLLVIMSEETGDAKYRDAAVRAAEYVWANWGARGFFVGGASDNPNNTDKEAGMLSMEAYLSLYESTREPRWLERAQAAADFTESWIWIWNLPMPVDADDSQLHWKKGVSTVGVQGITARVAGSVDEYLDWAVASYAKLYSYTKDQHYLDVARLLLHDTKSMVALSGRQYDMKGIGWQQEGWRMGPGGPGRGMGGHRFWLPWVSANHLYSITGLEEFDPVLYRQMAEEGRFGKTERRQTGFFLVMADEDSARALPAISSGLQMVRYDSRFLRDSERGKPRYLLMSSMADVPLVLVRAPELHIKGSNGFPELQLELAGEASASLEQLTREHPGGEMAFVIDGVPVTVHKIRSVITGGQFRISRCTDNACQYIYGRLLEKQR
jgi:hypothetical protein